MPLLVPEVEFSDIAFWVVAGDSDVRRRLELPRREMRDGSRRDVLDWTEDSDLISTPHGGPRCATESTIPTEAMYALLRACGSGGAQSVAPTHQTEPSDDEPKNIVKYIRDLNQKRTEINTVAVGDFLKFPILVRFLNQLTKDNKDQFVGVMR